MAINLVKGQRISIGLNRVGVGLGWDPNESGGADFDLDASAFMLNAKKKVPTDQYFVFYRSECRTPKGSIYPDGCPISPDGSVMSTGDDTTGGSSDGDDETLNVDMSMINTDIQEIIFVVSIYESDVRKQNFGQVRNSFIRIYNAETNEEICKYELGEDFSVETCIEFGRLYRRGSEWKFEAMGIGYKSGLQELVNKYT